MNFDIASFKPKFVHTAFVQISGFLALGCGWLGGGEYVALSTLALSVYVAGNVVEQKVQAQENIDLKSMGQPANEKALRADG